MAKTRNFAEAIKKKLAKDADLASLVEQESFNAHVATEIYNARKDAGLSQAKLANLVGTQQPVIARLESADYDGHSLTMLNRIAKALNKRLHVEFHAPASFVPIQQEAVPFNPTWSALPPWKPTVSLKRKRHKVG
jgi:transcriptional regulator with XRE-family HTH domain